MCVRARRRQKIWKDNCRGEIECAFLDFPPAVFLLMSLGYDCGQLHSLPGVGSIASARTKFLKIDFDHARMSMPFDDMFERLKAT